MKRKKIGIVTISENIPNYGQRLQAYMVQHLLNKQGYECEMIQDARWYDNPFKLSSYVRDIGRFIVRHRYQPAKHGFRLVMLRWMKKNLKVSKFYVNTDTDLDKLDAMYDVFLVGSDQVWNPHYKDRGANSFTFLQFTKPEKRVAYAASIATNFMLPERVEEFKGYLKDFPMITMREESGARIIKELTGRDVQTVLDPTLMQTGDEWAKQCVRKPKQEKYLVVFTYCPLSKESQAEAERIAREKGVKILNLNQMPNTEDYSMESWMGYIKYADCVMTDSFHCMVFSILFHKTVTLIRHKQYEYSMGMRTADLLKRLEIPMQEISESLTQMHDVDWNNVERILQQKRQEAMEYINKAFPKQA